MPFYSKRGIIPLTGQGFSYFSAEMLVIIQHFVYSACIDIESSL